MADESEIQDAEIINEEALTPVAPTALEAVTRGEVMTQVDVARRYPRSIHKFRSTLLSLATSSQAIAQKCFYTLPGRSGGDNQGKPVSGPSVRMAEIMAAGWGNLLISTGLVAIDHDTVTVRARVWDMERNIAHSEEFVAPIVGSAHKGRKRYSDDMIATTIRAAQAKARRNAILAIVPRSYYEEIKDQIMQVSVGKNKPLNEVIGVVMKWWLDSYKVTADQILASIKKSSEAEITFEDVAHLKGFATAIKEGTITIEAVFGKPKNAAGDLAEKLKKEAAEKEPVKATEAAAAQAETKEPAAETQPAPQETTHQREPGDESEDPELGVEATKKKGKK